MTAGQDFACALLTGGGVKCWGYNQDGELGDGSTTNSSVPVDVIGLSSGVHAITAGSIGLHACARLDDGSAKCWGDGNLGQLGNNASTSSSVPVDVSNLSSGVEDISAGGGHTCAVVNGGVMCWGIDDFGQLGNGVTTSGNAGSPIPVAVSGISSGAQAVVAGGNHSCAVVDNAVQCWGLGNGGILGNGATNNSNVPVPVTGINMSVETISAGPDSSCAVVKANVLCWGQNGDGELGNDSTTDSSVPVMVTGLI